MKDKTLEEKGVFLLQRNNPVRAFATLVHSSEYKNPDVIQAMDEEMEKWRSFNAYEVVPDDGQEAIDGRWIINRKDEHDGLKVAIKARFCLRGFKELEKPRSDSPTVDRLSTKMLYALAGNEGWNLEAIDVTSAFLQGADLDREVYVRPPKEVKLEGFLWKMKKAAYGLYDASRRWWIQVMEIMMELGGKTLIGDESLIYFHRNGKLMGLISIHVDDFQATGSEIFFKEVMDVLAEKFKISKREKSEFRFTGVDVKSIEGNITIDQEQYKSSIQKIDIAKDEDSKRELTRNEYKLFRGLVGKLTWLSEMTRPDISFEVMDLASYGKEATVQNLKQINKIVDNVHKEEGRIKYSKVSEFEDLKILAITDGGLNRRDDRTQSVAGRIIFLSNSNETKVSPLLWKSKKIQTVCKSAKSAETRSMDKAIEDAIYLARSIREIYTGDRGEKQIPVDIITDSKSLLDSINSTRQVEEKLTRLIVKWIKQMLDSGFVRNVRWCNTNVCLADTLTKPGSKMEGKVLFGIFFPHQLS